MDESVLLVNMTFLLLVGGICSIIFKKLKMPAIIGYLLTGIIVANFWSGASEETDIIISFLANLGLVLLMFCIGLQINLKKLRKNGKFALFVVMIQVPIVICGGYIIGQCVGWSALESIFFGAILSGSSTAAVTIILKEFNILSREESETIILITIIEDIAQVLILSLATPLLIGETTSLDSMVVMLLTIVAFMVISIVAGLMFIPRILDWLGDKMSREILLIFSLGMCFAMSLASVMMGMSMAIGAFMMGIIVSQSKTRRTIEQDITPMKDIFMAMFFISIGLEIVPNDLITNFTLVIGIFLAYSILKFSSLLLAYFIGNKTFKLSLMSAMSLVVMGEFSFIIAKEAFDAGIISSSFYTSVIGAALVSMIALPLMMRCSDGIYNTLKTKTPQPILNAVGGAYIRRDASYEKLSTASKATSDKFKLRATYVYLEILLLIVIEIIFIAISPSLTSLISDVTNVSYDVCYIIVLFLNFLSLMPLLYKLVTDLKFVEKVLVDIERKAAEKGKGNLNRRSIRFYKGFIKANNWLIVLFISFMIIWVVPNSIGLWEHVVVTLVGAVVILIIYFIKYWFRS